MKTSVLTAMAALAALGAASAATAGETSSPEHVVDAFHEALRAGDAERVEALMIPGVVIAEQGGHEHTFAVYKAEHLPADMEFSRGVTHTTTNKWVTIGKTMASVVSETQSAGLFRGRPVSSRGMETMLLVKDKRQWRIAHIHWSSAPTPAASGKP